MNILLLNHHAGTPALGGQTRGYHLAREWVRSGHRVAILAADQSHRRPRQPQPGKQLVEGTELHWLPTRPYQGQGVGRLRNILSYLGQVWTQAEAIALDFQPAVVISSSTYPMDHWPARRIAQAVRKAGKPCKLVHEVHEPWPLALVERSGMSPWHPFALICQSAEDAAYRHSDHVVSVLPRLQQHMAQRGLDLKKLSIVPNGISPEAWKASQDPLRDDVARALAEAREARQTIVGHAGSPDEPDAMDHLLDAARLCAGKPLRFVLLGDGERPEHLQRLQRRIRDEGLSQMHWMPAIPAAQLPAFLAGVDIAWVGWRRVPTFRFGIAPDLLLACMMAGKAVLHAVEAGSDPVQESGCGLSVPPEDASALAQGLQQLASMKPAERKSMGERGRQFVLKQHSYPVLAARFLAAVG